MTVRTLEGRLTTTASGAVCWEVYAATYDLAEPVTSWLRTHHGFGRPSCPIDGFDEVIATIARPGLKLELGWDIWSGFYVFGDGPEADALVRAVAAEFDPKLSLPEFQRYRQDW